MHRRTRLNYSVYGSTVGCTFLVDKLYGCKHSPHIGTCNLPYVYVKTVLFCVSGCGMRDLERDYVHGLIDCLIPVVYSNDGQTKLELMQFVDAVPSLSGSEDKCAEAAPAAAAAPPPLSDAVTSFLSGALLPTTMARVLLYDAVSACVADGEYEVAEKERVAAVAARLGVTKRVREIIETLAIEERKLAMMKRKLLMTGDTTR